MHDQRPERIDPKRGLHSDSNPFSTCYVRPGALPYHFSAAESAERLVARLRHDRWWGQLVGSHGTGKSTLLHALAPLLRQQGRNLVWFTLHADRRRLVVHSADKPGPWNADSQVIVDGYEQLGFATRYLLRYRCRRCRAGLLITTHRATRLPTLLATRPTLELVRQLVHQLMRTTPITIADHEVARAFAAHQGNVRDTLFALYDLYEQRRTHQAD